MTVTRIRRLSNMSLVKWTWVLPAVAWIVVLAAPGIGMGPYGTGQIMLISTTALMVSGLNLSLGYAGELSMGQVAIFAAAAYTTGYLSKHNHADLAVTMVISILIAIFLGLLTGLPGARLGGWSLAMVSFFMVLLVPDVVALFERQTGGYAGMPGIPLPHLVGHALGGSDLYFVVVISSGIWFLLLRNLVTSPYGVAFRVLRESPILARSLGINVTRQKLLAYTLGAVPAGVAGCLYASVIQFLDVSLFSFAVVVSIIAASVLGGSESVYGAVFGAAVLQIGPAKSAMFHQYALVAYGILLLVVGVLLPHGISGLLKAVGRSFWQPKVPAGSLVPASDFGRIDGKPLLLSDVTKRFGGVTALDAVSISAEPGEVTALIGANGSGKTTLLNLISGFYSPDGGEISLGTTRLAGRPHLTARTGIARTFQTPLIPRSLTVSEVLSSARYHSSRPSLVSAMLRLPRYRKGRLADESAVSDALSLLGLEGQAQRQASQLSLGLRRVVELARALMSAPSVVLLDEPLSGLDPADRDHVVLLVNRLKRAGATVILVEHDFDRVLSVADRIFVFEAGRLLACGTAAEIRRDPRVAASYLTSKGLHESPGSAVRS